MSLCIRLPNSIHPQRRCDVISIFKMAAAAAQFYFRFQIGWRRSFSDVSFYQQTKFRSYNSIRDWDITISGLEKQTFTIMEFYFRFWFRPYHRSRHIIPYCSLRNFYQNRTAHGRKITSCRFSRWRNSAILDFRGPIMVFLKSPYMTSYTSKKATRRLDRNLQYRDRKRKGWPERLLQTTNHKLPQHQGTQLYKLETTRSRLELRQNFFSQRVTSHWNRLLEEVVQAE